MPTQKHLRLLLFFTLLTCIFWQLLRHPIAANALTYDLSSEPKSFHSVAAQREGTLMPGRLGSWRLPLDPPALLVREFRSPNSDYSSGHRGVDYAVEADQPLLAPSAGTISFAGLVANKPVVVIAHQKGFRSTFEPACSRYPTGTTVLVGAEFGAVCPKGYRSHCAPALCLHFALRHDDGYLSPLALIGGLAPSVLTR